MEKNTQMGTNRTGMDMSPIDSKAMVEGAERYTQLNAPNGHNLRSIERQYIQEADALGSVPLPGTVRGALKSMMDKLSGRNPEMLLNKMGERLAYERTGVRFYESFINKCEVALSKEGQARLPLDELRQIRDEEAEHFQMLKAAMVALGADPTAQTPDADVSGVAAMGIQQVLNDPRTSVTQFMEMLVTIELTDNAAWDLLIKLAQDMGLDELASQFSHALAQEETHLMRVRNWYEQLVRDQAQIGGSTRHH